MLKISNMLNNIIYAKLNGLLNYRGYQIITNKEFDKIKKMTIELMLVEYGIRFDKVSFVDSINNIDLNKSKSQLGQDIFCLLMLDFKSNGFFLEFGAYDGIKGSNTYLMESIGWQGILVEPSKEYRKLKKNRSVQLFNLAVFSQSDLVIDFLYHGSLSTLYPFVGADHHYRIGKMYKVKTITLHDLLQKAAAPILIDYLSIDTEGSEFEILKNFDFDEYRFSIITIEHNFDEFKRSAIYELLSDNNYVRVLFNQTKHDDFYLDKGLFLRKKNFFSPYWLYNNSVSY